MTMRVVAVSNKAEVRKRLSRGSLLLQTAQLQPNTGTPLDVPVPRKVRTSPNPSEGGESLTECSLRMSYSRFIVCLLLDDYMS